MAKRRRHRPNLLYGRCVQCRRTVDLGHVIPDDEWERLTGWPGTNLRNKVLMVGQPDSAAFDIGARVHRADQVLCSACIAALRAA